MTSISSDPQHVDVDELLVTERELWLKGPPHEVFAHLRRTQPVYWQERDGGAGCWAVLKHADVVHVARHPNLFSASDGGVVIEDLDPDQLAMMRMMLLAMDPPGHAEYRRPLAPHFNRQAIARLEPAARTPR